MKVFELIQALQACDPNAEVVTQELVATNDDEPILAFCCAEEVISGYTDGGSIYYGVCSDLSFGPVPYRVSGYLSIPAVYIKSVSDEVRVVSPNNATWEEARVAISEGRK